MLYRDFLFSVVDRELLSTRGTGDASRFLLQIVTLLICFSAVFCLSALVVGVQSTALSRLVVAWSVEHFLIATTMLVVGVLAVLSWDRMFPGQRDVFVLGPLPIAAGTMVLAKLGALVTAAAVAVAALHAATVLIVPLALTRLSPDLTIYAPLFTRDSAVPRVDAAGLKAVLDRDFAAMVRDGPLAPGAGGGLAIGVYQRGERAILTYGSARPDSIFGIASNSKPFTGVLLAALATHSVVRLEAPVRELIADADVAPPDGDEITLLDLATHRSGLPGMPPTFRPADPGNPAADFGVSTLYAYLRNRGVYKRAQPAFTYSNLGFALLGHALSRSAGTDYATLLRQIIAEPLGMPDTGIALSPDQQRRLLPGYDAYRLRTRAWDFDVLAAAGGVRSTVSDMLVWLEANLHPERVRDQTLSAALAASHRPRSRVDGDIGIGLAWMVRPAAGTFEHGGAILGFTSDTFFDPANDLAVVVLTNVGPRAAWSADAVGEHVRARLDGRPALSVDELAIAPTGGVGSWLRLLAAYVITMTAAGLFMCGLAATVHGLASALLPRRRFVRVSSWLQLATFGLVVGAYFLQPMLATPDALLAAQGHGLLAWSPSYWFLGLFQQLTGSPAFAPLAARAWIGLAFVIMATTAAYGLSHARTLRQIAEQPDISAPVVRWRWPSALRLRPRAAIAAFAVRTVLRSGQHRMILAFYSGIGAALTLFLLKVPRGQQLDEGPITSAWDEGGVPLLVSSIITMAFAVVAARLAFAMPRELHANWIFRMIPNRRAHEYQSARRRALLCIAVAPVWLGWVAVFLWQWSWQPAGAHLLALALFGLVLAEAALIGSLTIPCACSYLPGKSQLHLVFVVAVLLFVGLTLRGARLELEALQSPMQYAFMVGVLAAIWVLLRSVASRQRDAAPMFDAETGDEAVTLGLWDSRSDMPRADVSPLRPPGSRRRDAEAP